MIVALHQANLTPDHALNWWAGTSNAPLQAPRRGYIVIAPDYIPPGTTEYISNPQSHRVVLAAIRDALRRFSVDSDRVFLSGHGSGGEATLDIGMAHADLFAGAIPIVAIAGPACDRLYKNCSDLPWYVILGERHRDSLAENSAVLDRLARVNPDVTICVYRDRGFESYYEEIHNLFDWMENHARGPMPAQFEVVTVRPEDRSFFWLEADGFPDFLQNQNFRRGPGFRPVKSVEFNLRVTPANSVDIIRAGANDLTLRLMDGVVDFDKPIRIGMRRRGRIDPAPSIADVLDDFSRYRDGSRIALQRVAL